MIKENERIDELNLDGLKIIQNEEEFMYGTDAVILSDFVTVGKKTSVLDLCTGNGIIPILLYAKYRPERITGIEYFENIADRARRSLEINAISDKIDIICGDIKNIERYIKRESFDYVSANPPYMVSDSGFINKNDFKKAARHEILCDLEDVVKAAAYSLKYGGRFGMVHRSERLADVISLLRKYKIEPKRFSFAYSDISLPPKLILIEGKKGAGAGLVFEPPVRLEKM